MKAISDFGLGKLAYGGDWNPEQWDPSVWKEDISLFKAAGIDLLSINIFSWTLCQPAEDVYDFSFLDKIVELCREAGLKVCLGTATAAHPAWMASKYSDVLRVDFQGRKRKFGDRHNSCPSSPTYRKFAPKLAGKLAAHFRHEPTVVLWHVSNEYMGACYCSNCEKGFREWLKRRYQSLAALNEAWYTRFWNQTYTEWDQIVLPNALTVQWGERNTAMPALTLDFMRFNSENICECFRLEAEAIRREIPKAVITTNFMGAYRGLDYRRWAGYLDIISWDNYPQPGQQPALTAMLHSLMRGLKPQQPFLLMEQTPSQTNWQPYTTLKRPGEMRLLSYQAVAHGADSVMFFQMRRSRGGCEKFHGAVIEHSGRSDTRVFREVSALGQELKQLGDAILGSTIKAEVALWFDWESFWAAENAMGICNQLNYVEEVFKYYRALYDEHIQVDLVGPGSELSGYKILWAPVFYLVNQEVTQRIMSFVRDGGILVTTYLSGMVDDSDRVFVGGPPGPLKDILGLWVEETDVLQPEIQNELVIKNQAPGFRTNYKCSWIFDIVRPTQAEVWALYGKEFYAGSPALTLNYFGCGSAWYLATGAEDGFLRDFNRFLCQSRGVGPVVPGIPPGVEVTQRIGLDGTPYLFFLNHTHKTQEIRLTTLRLEPLLPLGPVTDCLILKPFEVFIGKRLL